MQRKVLQYAIRIAALSLLLAGHMRVFAQADTIPESSLVVVEGQDSLGRVLTKSVGVIVKDGFVALNYHTIAGMHKVKATIKAENRSFYSDGYLSVDESKDLIVISVPELKGTAAMIDVLSFPGEGQRVRMAIPEGESSYKVIEGKVQGKKEFTTLQMPQIISQHEDEITHGPVFHHGAVVGFITAGYWDQKYYSYAIASSDLRRLLNRSFIIKNFNSLKDNRPLRNSPFQTELMESLSSVLWLSINDAERLTARKPRMILITVTSKWTGWGKLQNKNFTSKRIIRYLNENFYAVKLDAETSDTIVFNRLPYMRNPGSPYHSLAYSLLEGQMDFPSTVLMDENLTVLYVIPGLMGEDRFEVVLHYFAEKAYNNSRLSFPEYESLFLSQRGN